MGDVPAYAAGMVVALLAALGYAGVLGRAIDVRRRRRAARKAPPFGPAQLDGPTALDLQFWGVVGGPHEPADPGRYPGPGGRR